MDYLPIIELKEEYEEDKINKEENNSTEAKATNKHKRSKSHRKYKV
jgi:hypothetical protein